MGTITVSEVVWGRLSEDQQAIVTQCANTAATDQIAANRAAQDEFLDGIAAGGVTVTELPPEAMKEFVDLGRSLWSELEDAYGADRIAALRAEVGADVQ